MNLYWVETEDHGEDWFVVAHDSAQAERFHADAEGYGERVACANLVVAVPRGIAAQVGRPPDDLLEACGGRIVRREPPRVVEIAGQQFCEGMLDSEIRRLYDDESEALGRGRPNRTRRQCEN